MRSSRTYRGKLAATARVALALGWLAGCTVGDPDDDLFDDDGGTGRDGSVQADTGMPPDDEDGGPGPGPKPDAGGQPSTGTKLTDLPRLLASATCDALEACLDSKELLADTLGGRDCWELQENLLLAGPLAFLPASVENDLIVYRPGEVENCMEDLRALGCDVRSSRWPASCELMLLGTVELGKDCTINQDCAGDAFCDLGAMASCPGTCAPLQSAGMPCNNNDDDQCEDGLVCFRGECRALGDQADDCGTTLPRCAPGLVCASATSECTTIPVIYFRKLDEACQIGTQLCEPGLVCESTMGTMGVCKHTVAKDAACKRADPNQCPLDQYCDAEMPGVAGTCRNRPVEGQPCLNRAQACADGHVCVGSTCRELLQVGEGCVDDEQCYSGVCGELSKCAAPLMCDL